MKEIPKVQELPESVAKHLSISAHVVVQLGEELVTDVEQALLELAKNAYDADSRSCSIKVEPNWELHPGDPAYKLLYGSDLGEPKKIGRIRIRDYGTGISKDAVDHGWLRISASLKRVDGNQRKAKTQLGRTPVGDKGLGRLATMKLGQVLRMKTAVEEETSWRTVMFSWNDFTQDRTLDEVTVIVGTDAEEAVEEKGTMIEVLGLTNRDEWADANYVEKHLIPHLSSLINPFQGFDNFEISLNTGRHQYDLQSLDDGVLNLSSSKFSFRWDGKEMLQEGWISSSLFRGERGEEKELRFNELFGDVERPKLIEWLGKDKKLKDKGISFDVQAPWFCKFSDRMDAAVFPSDKKFQGGKDPGPFQATFYYFLFHEFIKQKLTAAQVSSETIQAMSQLAIYRDGFRVRAHRDWLRLSEGTTSGSSFYGLRPANVMGFFSISNEENPGLIEKSDREGFLDNPEFRGFMILGMKARDYANSVLEAIRKSVREYSKRLNDGGVSTRKQLVETINTASAKAEKSLIQLRNELAQTQKELEQSRKVMRETTTGSIATNDEHRKSDRAVDDHISNVNRVIGEIGLTVERQTKTSMILAEMSTDDEDYATRMLDAAAVGLAARSLGHELNELTRQLKDGVARISAVNKQLKNPELATAVKTLTGAIRELGKMISTIDPMLPGSRTVRENIELAKFLTEYVDARDATAARNGIKLNLVLADNETSLVVRFNRTRLLQIVENLFQNSIYWLNHGPLPQQGVKQILIRITSRGFVWSDTGPGIRPSIESSIFDAYVSDKPKSEGSGIGLHVVSTFLEMERCSIHLNEKRNALNRRYEFEIDLSPARPESQQPKL
jgi:signal transduction histidine kinase